MYKVYLLGLECASTDVTSSLVMLFPTKPLFVRCFKIESDLFLWNAAVAHGCDMNEIQLNVHPVSS